MSTKRWIGGSAAVAKVITVTVGGTVETTDIFKLTIGTKTLTVVAGSTTPATVAASIVSAWNALSTTEYPEFAEITAANGSGGTLTLTADTAGKDFSVTLTTTETGGGAADDQTFTQSTTTANAGPNDWSTAANWSGGAIPVNSDEVIVEDATDSILYGLDQSAVTGCTLIVRRCPSGFTIGLPVVNADGDYPEYRPTYLALGCTTVTIDAPLCGRLKLDTGSGQTAVTVREIGPTTETNIPALCWKGTHASNALHVLKGVVGVAFFATETATLLTLKTGYKTSINNDAEVYCGTGTTLSSGTITQGGGEITIESAVATIDQVAGTLTVNGAATITTATVGADATLADNSSGTITTLNLVGTYDLRGGTAAKTVTNANVYRGYAVHDPAKRVTWTNGLDHVQCGPDDGTLDCGDHRTWTPSAI